MLFLENSLLSKAHIIGRRGCLLSSSPMEEGEGEDGDGYCTSDVQEFVYRGTSVLVMGPSRNLSFRDDARPSGSIGKFLLLPHRSVWSLIRSGRAGVKARHLSFFTT